MYTPLMAEPAMALRERTRLFVRGEIVAVAMDLFLEQGFEETTIEQIATGAGLSRRSYFRYFASKDDVLAEALFAAGAGIATALAGRPAEEAEWTALRRAFDVLLQSIDGEARALPMTRVMLSSPTLHGSHQQKQNSWRDLLSSALEARLDASAGDVSVRADALAGAALACLTAAQNQWVAADNAISLGDLLDTAMASIHQLE